MLHIPDVLNPAELHDVGQLLRLGRFVDGRWTSGGQASAVKENLLLDDSSGEVDRIVLQALSRNALFQAYALPARFAPPMVSRYEPGMRYGQHVDSALMGRDPTMRTDVAMTLFLSDPESYEGGELVVELQGGQSRVKLPAGHAVVYAAGATHEVEAVRSGVRTAFISWAQSYVRDAQLREVLFDLHRALERVEHGSASDTTARLLLKTYNNLYRRFAET